MTLSDAFSLDPSNKIKKEGVADKVVRRILELIKSGNLKAGDRLPAERELIEIFNVSRPTLREALRALSVLGVTESRHGGGAFVTNLDGEKLLAPLEFFVSLSEKNVQESFDCRRLIEVEIAGLCAEKATPEDISKLDNMLRTQENVGNDPIAFRMLDSEFHACLYKMSGNSMMERLATGFYNMGLEERRIATESSRVTEQSLRDHKKIVAGIKSGDRVEAMETMARHINHIESTTIEAMM